MGRNGSNMFMYVNGVDVSSGSVVDDDVPAFGVNLFLGKSSGYWGYIFEGVIDEFYIFNRALSSSEALELYNLGV